MLFYIQKYAEFVDLFTRVTKISTRGTFKRYAVNTFCLEFNYLSAILEQLMSFGTYSGFLITNVDFSIIWSANQKECMN